MPDDAPNEFHFPTGDGQLAGNDKIGSRGHLQSEIFTIRLRLLELKGEQSRLEATLANLERELSTFETTRPPPDLSRASVTNGSPASAKVALFRHLFQGRADVYPARWENMKSSRAGYSPACANEWVRGTCAKPKVKCGECPHQAFIPVSDEVINKHLRGGAGGAAILSSASTRCSPTEPAGFLPPILTRLNGRKMQLRCLKRAVSKASPPRWSAPDRGTAGMSGCSLMRRSRPPSPDRWELHC
jgi:hypothetical protein